MSIVDVINLTLGLFAGLVVGFMLGIMCAKGQNNFYYDDDEGRK